MNEKEETNEQEEEYERTYKINRLFHQFLNPAKLDKDHLIEFIGLMTKAGFIKITVVGERYKETKKLQEGLHKAELFDLIKELKTSGENNHPMAKPGKSWEDFMETLEPVALCPYCMDEVGFEPTDLCCGEVHGEMGFQGEEENFLESDLKEAFESWKKGDAK